MIARCECQKCGQAVEFEAAQFERSGDTPYRILGQTIDCPNCQQLTQIYMPRQRSAAITERQQVRPQKIGNMISCPDCGNQVSRNALFCPSCGAFERGLLRNIWRIVSTFWFLTLIIAVIGWIIWDLLVEIAMR